MRIGLVSCSALKLDVPAPARDLYRGKIFRPARAVAEALDAWWILSAKHGLTHPDAVIEPYDETIAGNAPMRARRLWADRHAASVEALRPATFVVMAGAAYRGAIGGAVVLPSGIERMAMLTQPGRLARRLEVGMPKVLVVGVAPGPSHGERRAFLGSSSGAALERLWGMQPGELGLLADTANLAPSWPGRASGGLGDAVPAKVELVRAAAELDLTGYSAVVLCGAAVAGAMGFDPEPLRVHERDGRRFLVLPHPSPVNRWWNESSNRTAARRALSDIAPLGCDLLAAGDGR